MSDIEEEPLSVSSKAFVYYAPGDVRREILDMKCPKDGLLVRIRVAGLCSTDRSIYLKGHPKVDSNTPVVLGHELCGEIVERGPQVGENRKGIGYWEGKEIEPELMDFHEGERVTFQSRIAQYRDGLMLTENPITILSFRMNGGYAEYMEVPGVLLRSGSVLRVPTDISDVSAALVEPAACALEALFATPHACGVDHEGRHLFRAGVKDGGYTCIIGSGTLAMIYALLAKRLGAERVMVLVRSQDKAKLVEEILQGKAEPCMIPKYSAQPLSERLQVEAEIVNCLRQRTEGRLFDDVVLACPDPDAQRLMLDLYSMDGYAVGSCFAGIRTRVDQVDLDSNHYRMAKTIGTSGCSTRTMETVMHWLEQGQIALDNLVSPEHFDLDCLPHDFFTAKTGGLKPILYPCS